MRTMKHTSVTALHIHACPGANLGECMREAALMACLRWQNVILTHQDQRYRVLCNDLIDCVQKFDNESVEQSCSEWQSELGGEGNE